MGPSVPQSAASKFRSRWRWAPLLLLGLTGCGERALNDPYPAEDASRAVLYTTFQERPKHLDPTSSYSENEAAIIAQIYEPLVQYHFLKRPYELAPLTATAVPAPQYFDAAGSALPEDAPDDQVKKVVYRISIQPGIRFQPHPAFARGTDATAARRPRIAARPGDLP